MNLHCRTIAVIVIALSFSICSAYAGNHSKADLAKAAQNPIANMISLPLQNNINTGIGPDDETQNRPDRGNRYYL